MLTATPLRAWGVWLELPALLILSVYGILLKVAGVPPAPGAVTWASCRIPLSAVLEKERKMISLNSLPYPGPPR